MTRFECPRCQHVFTADSVDDQAFADCPKCSSLALATGVTTDSHSSHLFGGSVDVTDEGAAPVSAEGIRPAASPQRSGVFTGLVADAPGAPSAPKKMPASLFAAPPSLEGDPVIGEELSPFAGDDGEEEEDLYRAQTEAYVPENFATSTLGGGAAAGFGMDAAPWAGLPTSSHDGPATAASSFDAAAKLPSLSPLDLAPVDDAPVFSTEVDERPSGLDDAIGVVGTLERSNEDVSSDDAWATSQEHAAALASDDESVFGAPAPVRPSLTIDDNASGPHGIIIDPSLSESAAASFGAEPSAAESFGAASTFGDMDLEGTDLSHPEAAAASLEQINASQEGTALDDGHAASLFAGASFDDLEAAFDEAADRPGLEAQELARAEDALRQASSQEYVYERPPDADESHDLGVPSAPSAPRAPALTLKKAAQVPHLSLSAATISATALPLHGGSFETETSGAHAQSPVGQRGHNPALDEPTLVTRDRDDDSVGARGRRAREPSKITPDVVVPSLWAGITPLRIGAILFFACVLGTVFGALLAPGHEDKPITARVRAESQFAEGNRAYELGKFDDALGYFRGAIARDNTFGLGHRAMGTVLAKQQRHEEAARAYQTYLELTPGAVDAEQVREILRRYDPKLISKKKRGAGTGEDSPPDDDAATTNTP